VQLKKESSSSVSVQSRMTGVYVDMVVWTVCECTYSEPVCRGVYVRVKYVSFARLLTSFI